MLITFLLWFHVRLYQKSLMVQIDNAGKFENALFSTVNQVVENLCYYHCLNKQNLHLSAKTCRGIKKTTI